MKRKTVALALTAAALAGAPRLEAQILIDPTLAVDLVSTYVFRGVDVTHAPALQPWATVAFGTSGFSATAWASFALTDRERVLPYASSLSRGGADEIDLVAAFSRPVGPAAIGLGYVAYIYPASQQDYVTQEIYGSLGLAIPLAPALTVYYDFDGTDAADAIEGVYASLGATQSIPVGLPLDLGASVGWTDQDALRADPGIHDLNVTAGVPIPFLGLAVTPTVGFTHLMRGSAYLMDGKTSHNTVWAKIQLKLP